MTGVVGILFHRFYFHFLLIMEKKQVSRKKFLLWGVGVSSVLALPSIFLFGRKKAEPAPANMVRMLGEDGKLVEVDMSKIAGSQGKIKDKDIHTWVKTKKNQL